MCPPPAARCLLSEPLSIPPGGDRCLQQNQVKLALLGFGAITLVYLLFAGPWGGTDTLYSIMMDAGSTGSRIHVCVTVTMVIAAVADSPDAAVATLLLLLLLLLFAIAAATGTASCH